MLRCLPGVAICQPCDEEELVAMLGEALDRGGPTVIRYPRGAAPRRIPGAARTGLAAEVLGPDRPVQIWAVGDQLAKALEVAAATGAGVVHARYIKPFDSELLARQRAAGKRIVSIENAAVAGGFGEAIGADVKFGWPDSFVPHGDVDELERAAGLDVESIKEALNG
jgi:1-deoxy-D-xylulose-5-phosphate synthase